ncbi:hypothetical protein CRG98_048553, partial [Punica granatum]
MHGRRAGRGQACGRAGVRAGRAGVRGSRVCPRACARAGAGVRGRARGWRWRVTIHPR